MPKLKQANKQTNKQTQKQTDIRDTNTPIGTNTYIEKNIKKVNEGIKNKVVFVLQFPLIILH